MRGKLHAGRSGELVSQAREVAGVKVLVHKAEGIDGKGLREFSDRLRDKLGSGVIVLGCESGGKANLLVAVTKELTGRIKAGSIIKPLAQMVGGGGGGRPDLAQAGGSQPEKLDEALAAAEQIVAEQLG